MEEIRPRIQESPPPYCKAYFPGCISGKWQFFEPPIALWCKFVVYQAPMKAPVVIDEVDLVLAGQELLLADRRVRLMARLRRLR